jgi:hypothetical protein
MRERRRIFMQHNTLWRSALLGVVISSCGCVDLLSVKGRSATQPNGIPFYRKAGVCRQETVYLEPVLELKLEQTEQAKEGPKPAEGKEPAPSAWVTVASMTQYVPFSLDQPGTECSPHATKLVELLCALSASPPKPSVIMAAWRALNGRATPYPTSPPEEGNRLLAANKVSGDSYVDYAHPLYYNGKMPWLGSAKATISLNTDGTLASAEGDAEPKVLQSILDVLPISAFLSAKLIPAAATPTAGQPKFEVAPPQLGPAPTRLHITVTAIIFKHTLTKTTALNPGQNDGRCPLRPPLRLNKDTVTEGQLDEYKLEELPAVAPDEAGKDKTKEEPATKLKPKKDAGKAR